MSYETEEHWLRELERNSAARGLSLGSPGASPEEEEQGRGHGVAGFLQRSAGVASRTAGATVRGGARAFNETSDAVYGGYQALQRAFGVKEAEAGTTALERYEEDIKGNRFRFQIREDRDEGIYGAVEALSQFAAGFVGAGKLIAPARLAARGAGAARTLGATGRGARVAGQFTQASAAGFLADTFAFSPLEERLSDMVERGPEWLSNPVTRALQGHEEDSMWEARLRAGAEGLILGSAVEGLVWGVRALRAKNAVAAGKMSKEEAEEVIGEALERAARADENAAVRVEAAEDGTAAVLVRGDNGAVERVTYGSLEEAHRAGAAISEALNNTRLPVGPLTEEQAAQFHVAFNQFMGEVHRVGPRALEGFHININRLSVDDEVKAMIQSMGKVMDDAMTATRARVVDGGPYTHEYQAKVVADAFMAFGMDNMEGILTQSMEHTGRLWFDVLSSRILLAKQAEKVRNAAYALSADHRVPEVVANFKADLDALARAEAVAAGIKADVGRALNSAGIQIDASGLVKTNPELARELAGMQGSGRTRWSSEGLTARQLQAMADQMVLVDDPVKIVELMRREAKIAASATVKQEQGFWRRLMGFRINAMLSGPKTHIVNATSTFGAAFLTPLEVAWAGVRTGNKALRQEGTDVLWGNMMFLGDMLGGLSKSLRLPGWQSDGWDATAQAFRTKKNVLDPQNMIDDTGRSLDRIFDNDKLDWVAGLATRMMMTSDEFFKQMTYRANVRASALKRARELGITDPREIGERVKAALEMSVREDGAAILPTGLDRARTVTFTNDLGYGIGKYIQEGRNKHPIIEVIMPFVRTPVNIVRFAWQRTPGLARFQRQWADDIAAGGERAAIAKAKVEIGSMVYAGAAMLALGGAINGGGPSQANLRRQWLEAGNQPYSIKLPGGKQISFLRMEPISTPVSIVADLVQMAGDMDQEDAMEAVWASVAAFSSSMTSKTFLRGISDFFDAVASGDERAVRRFGEETILSFSPNVLRQLNDDEMMREARGILQKFQSRIPGWSEDLEARRNIFGEQVMRPPGSFNRRFNPFTVMDAPDETLQALFDLGGEINMPQGLMENGQINLRDRMAWDNGSGQSPYDRWLEIVNNPGGGRKNLREDLTERMASHRWDRLNPGTDLFPGGARLRLAQQVIDTHYTRAWGQVLKEYPELKDAMKEAKREKVNSLRSGSVQQVQSLFGTN